VFQTGSGLVTDDADADPRHSDEIDLVTRYETRDMVTAPLKSSHGRCIGIIQVLNRREGRFDDRDLKMLEILAGEAASCIETSRLQSAIVDWEMDKRRFACEVLRCVTEDKLRLVDHEEIPDDGKLLTATCLTDPGGYAKMRECIAEAAAEAGMDPGLTADLTLAAGEAASNSIKHAIDGCAEVRRTPDRIIIDVRDRGPGIRPRDLPRVLFQAGFSTKISLGMGYTLMLELADRIWLATSPEGTRIRLEKLIHPAPLDQQPLRDILERFATV
jgi:anti-sigma regulatory factor (Ser/Thr protein kinase)